MQRIKIYMWLSLLALLGLLLYWWADRYQSARAQLQRELQLSVDEHLANEVLDIFNVSLEVQRDSCFFPQGLNHDSTESGLQVVVISDTTEADTSYFPRLGLSKSALHRTNSRFPEELSTRATLSRWIERRDTSLEAHLDSLGDALRISIGPRAKAEHFRHGDMLVSVRSASRFNEEEVVRIEQYRWQLLGSLWPELLAGSLLLLLTGLAFGQSWRTMSAQSKLVEDRDALIANLAHELKTPIATVGVALEAMENFGAETDPERRKDYLRLSRAELNRLDRLADQSLLSLQLQDPRNLQQIPLEEIDLRKSIKKCWESIQLRYSLNTDQLKFSSTDAVLVSGHNQHLEMVIDNLLTNAVKYGGEPLDIKVDSWHKQGRTFLRIADNGPGIPPAESTRIFERFYRIETEQGHQQKGHGLGLSLSRDLMRAMGGDLYLDTSHTEGAAFVIEFNAHV